MKTLKQKDDKLKFSCSKYRPDHTVEERLNEVGQTGVGSSVEAAVIIHKMEKRASPCHAHRLRDWSKVTRQKGVRDQNTAVQAEQDPRPPSSYTVSSLSRVLVCKQLAGARTQLNHE